MRRNNRTPCPPLFTVDRPIGHAWTWTVTFTVASSGYVVQVHVIATRHEGIDPLVGVAFCDVSTYDVINDVIECLVIEAMLAACEPTLDGTTPSRRIQYSSHL